MGRGGCATDGEDDGEITTLADRLIDAAVCGDDDEMASDGGTPADGGTDADAS